MGLDVWCYKIKNKDSLEKYKKINKEYDDYCDFLWKKYDKETIAAYNKWNAWKDELETKLEENKISLQKYEKEIKKDPYHYTITDFTTSDEKLKYELLIASEASAKQACGMEEIENLYMRKQYWFIQHCYHKFDEYMTVDERFKCKALDNENHYYDMVLTKDDVNEIILKLGEIIGRSYELINDKEVKNVIDSMNKSQMGYNSIIDIEILDCHKKIAVTLSWPNKEFEGIIDVEHFNSVFPIYKEYVHSARLDTNYDYDDIVRYYDEWRKLYDTMKTDELIWVHEWW